MALFNAGNSRINGHMYGQ